MDNQNRKLELLGNAPIPKALLAMGIPTMIGMLINALYNLVDAYFVGGLGESQMAAISVVYPLGQVVVGLGLLFGNGAASYISRLLGQRNKDQANKVASTALYSSLVVGAIMIMLFGYYTVYSSLFLALGKGKEGFILGACRQGICFIPVILIFPFIWGLNGILYAQPIADVLSALITVFMAIPLHKSLTIAEQKMKTTSIPCDRQ